MKGISAIIPCMNEAHLIVPLIRQLVEQGFDEIIVVDASPDDQTAVAAAGAGAKVIRCPVPCRGAQMQIGASAAHFDDLFFVHADSHLPTGAHTTIKHALTQPEISAGSFRLAFDHPHPVLRFYAWCSHLNLAVTTFGDQGLFVRRATFDAIGGFAPMALLEDYEIQFRLRKQGRFEKLPLSLTTSARRYLRRGVIKQQALNVAIVIAFSLGVSVDRLRAWYQGR